MKQKTILSVILALLIITFLSLPLSTVVPTVQEAEAARQHNCGWWEMFWNGNVWIPKWVDHYVHHANNKPHAKRVCNENRF